MDPGPIGERSWFSRRWPSLRYVTAGLVALALYGWALLSVDLTPRWVGWACIGLTAFWLALTVVLGVATRTSDTSYTIPTVLLITPFLIGVGLFVG